MTPFFMVWMVGKPSPRHVHETYEKAETEAKRLTAKFGGKAVILESVCRIKTVDLLPSQTPEFHIKWHRIPETPKGIL